MDNNEDDIVVMAILSFMQTVLATRQKKEKAKIDPYLKKRNKKGRFIRDFNDLAESKKKFMENFHMDLTAFEKLYVLCETKLLPQRCTRHKDAIAPKEKLAVVLEYFACGTLQRHVSSVYRISKQHFGQILDQVCDALVSALQDQIPALNRSGFVNVANDFNAKWNFPNCIGAIDGKHVSIQCPRNAGSLFYNYKGFHSIILMAVADANYKFTYLDIGAYGSEGDAGVFANCDLGKSISDGTLDFPNNAAIEGVKLPYYFIGDDAFPLHKRIMKPYVPKKPARLKDEEKIFNYRLSRARRCVENSFGILCSKWICLGRTMFCGPHRARKMITACCYLHNFLLQVNKDSYCPPKYADYYDDNGRLIEGEWRRVIPDNSLYSSDLESCKGRNNNCAKDIRNRIKNYVNSPRGSIPWQRQSAGLE